MKSSILLKLRDHFTIQEAADVLKSSLEEPIGFNDVLAMIEQGRLELWFYPLLDTCYLQRVSLFCPLRKGLYDDCFWVDADEEIVRRSGRFRVSFFTGLCSEAVSEFDAETNDDLHVMTGIVFLSDWDRVTGAGLVVDDGNGSLCRVLYGCVDGTDEAFEPYTPPIDGEMFRIPASQLLALMESALHQDEKQTSLNDIHPRERNTMCRIIIGLAIDGHGYDPADKRSTVAREVSQKLDELGIPVSDDTVRKYLKEAAAMLSGKPR